MKNYKAIILLGSQTKGTRFRPLSFHTPKSLFPTAGKPLIYHTIEQIIKFNQLQKISKEENVYNLQEILIFGLYDNNEKQKIEEFILKTSKEFSDFPMKYLNEPKQLGFKIKNKILIKKKLIKIKKKRNWRWLLIF
jgi:mannose-1-phosphate guanylyltransferase